MSKFLEKVLKLVLKLKSFRFMEKFINFLLSVLGGKNGDILDNICKTVNLAVDTVELLEDTIKDKLEDNPLDLLSATQLLEEVKEDVPGCLTNEDDLNLIDDLVASVKKNNALSLDSLTVGVITDEQQAIKDELKAKYEKMEIKFKLARNSIVRNLEENKFEYTMQLVSLAISASVIKLKK